MLSLCLSHLGRRAAFVFGSVVIVSTVACSDDATAPMAPTSPAVTAPSLGKAAVVLPIVDGKITPGEYDGGDSISFRVLIPTTEGAQPAMVYITHDKKYLYVATTFDRKSPFHTNDMVMLEFDNDNDGIREDGDDIFGGQAFPNQNVPYTGADYYRFNGGMWNQSDPVINVISAFGSIGTKGVFEVRQELNSTDNAHDFSIDPAMGAVTVGMIVGVSLEANPINSNVYVHTHKPSAITYCKLTIGKKTTSVSCP